MSFPNYSEYKDSGVEWLGEVPAYWSVQRLSWLFDLISSGTTPPSDTSRYYEGDTCWVTTGELREGVITDTEKKVSQNALLELSALRIYPVGTLLIALYGATIGRLGVLGVDACTNQACCALANPIKVWPRFVFYALFASKEYLLLIASGGGQPNINQDKVRSLRIGVPALEDQEIIAGFLDHETQKIDFLISEQEKLIALLKEKRQAVISHAVTKGLDPNAPMKDSGIEWLGEVPVHWMVASVRRFVRRIEQGWSPECFSRPAEEDEWGVLKAGCVNRGALNETENKALPIELAPIPEYEVRKGDLLMSRASGSPELVGSTAYVKNVRPRLMLSDKIFRIVTEDSVLPQYFAWLFNSLSMRAQIERSISGADGLANNLPQSSLFAFWAAVPPIDEQLEIVAYLDPQVAGLDELMIEANCGIDLLKERRSALISAAVTGKIDVRQLAATEAA